MGQVTKIRDVVKNLKSYSDEMIIFAQEPWNYDSAAVVIKDSEAEMTPNAATELGAKYLLEVSIAREFLDGALAHTTERTIDEQCEMLIHYAIYDS